MDLRTKKIYDALIKAFKELLEEKNFEQITVNELCEKAQTRRATFYKHFSDKYDFFDFMLHQTREEIMREVSKKIDTEDINKYYYLLVDIGLDFVQKNKKLLLSICNNSNMGFEMIQTITGETNKELQQLIISHNENKIILDEEIEVQFLIGALNQCSKWWILNMNKVSKEKMKETMYILIDRFFLSFAK